MSYDVEEELPARKSMRKRTIVLSALAVGGIASGGAYAYAASGTTTSGSPAGAAPTSSSSSSSTSSSSSSSQCPKPGSPGNDFDGQISAVSSSSITVKNLYGTSRTYKISSSTSVHEGPATSAKVSDLRAGEHVHVRGSKSSSTYTATDIDVHPATIDGRVTAASSTGLTVSDKDGFTRTIVLDSGTKYTSNGTSSSRSAITTGSVVHAQGTVDADGTSLDADTVAKTTASYAPAGPGGPRAGGSRPAGPPAGCGPAGGPGRHGGHGGSAPSGAPKAPSGSGTKSSGSSSGGSSSGSSSAPTSQPSTSAPSSATTTPSSATSS